MKYQNELWQGNNMIKGFKAFFNAKFGILFVDFFRMLFVINTKNPLKRQKKILKKILNRNKTTKFQKDFGIHPGMKMTEFREKMPLSRYETYIPYVERMKNNNEKNVLTDDDIVFFSLTTGTSSGKPKTIPHTAFSLEIITRAYIPAMSFVLHSTKQKKFGRGLYFISTKEDGYTEYGIPFGTPSIAGQYLYGKKFKYDFTRILPYECTKVLGEQLEYLNWLFALATEDIDYISGLMPIPIIGAFHLLWAKANTLLNDLESGTLTDELNFSEDIRKSVLKYHKPNKERAQKIRRILKEDGHLNITKIWPNIKYLSCAKGGNNSFYVERLMKYLDNKIPIYGPGINGSEGVSGIGVDSGYEFVFTINSTFFEFIPIDNIEEEQPRTLLINELEMGNLYEIVYTVANGLYRYRLGDVVKITGMMNKTPKFEFQYRYGGIHGGVMSIVFEKVTEAEVCKIFSKIIKEFNLDTEVFMVGPEKEGVFPKYCLSLETENKDSKRLIPDICRTFDAELRKMNLFYDRLRLASEMQEPVAFFVNKNDIKNFFFKNARPSSIYQVKVPQLTEDKNFWDYIKDRKI
jgi:hypothetical protein